MATTPGEVPPPPPSYGSPATQIVGQQTAPSTLVPPPLPPGSIYAPAAQGQYNSTAIISLVTGAGAVLGHIPLPGIGGGTIALVAIITGFIARGQIKQTGERGMWMANAGIVLGFVHVAVIAIVILLILFFVFILGIAIFGFAAHSH